MFKKVSGHMKSNLSWYLIGCICIAGLIAIGSVYLLSQISDRYIEYCYEDADLNKKQELEYMDDLQQYVIDHAITVDNILELVEWTENHKYVYLFIYQKGRVIYNSGYGETDDSEFVDDETGDGEPVGDETGDGQSGDVETDEGYDDMLNDDNYYRLVLADSTVVSAELYCFDYMRYYYYIRIAEIIVGVFLFLFIFLRLFRNKLRYLNALAQEVQVLEGGNLEYPITIKGCDELGRLAQGIDQMRLSVIDNQKKEQKTLQANKSLVTSMSHDLRTPLTTLTGYLEILNMNRSIDEEKRSHYLELSLSKTREIKELSDQLFEYFLIYGAEQKKIVVEPVPVDMLVMDLIENQFLGLEENGYILESSNQIHENVGNCLINPQYMQRVLNNILSNLRKYADKQIPIQVEAEVENGFLVILVRNGIAKQLEQYESTKIGLVTCERIMKLHAGEFRREVQEDTFTVQLMIPMENNR